MDMTTKFKLYLLVNKIEIQDLAEKVGVNSSYLSRVIHGHTPPSKKLAGLIETETQGFMRPQDFAPEEDLPKSNRKKKAKKTHQKEEEEKGC